MNAIPSAAGAGRLDEVQDLLLNRHPALVNEADDDNQGWTLLHMAAFRGHAPIVRLALDRGAAINKTIHKEGVTALW